MIGTDLLSEAPSIFQIERASAIILHRDFSRNLAWRCRQDDYFISPAARKASLMVFCIPLIGDATSGGLERGQRQVPSLVGAFLKRCDKTPRTGNLRGRGYAHIQHVGPAFSVARRNIKRSSITMPAML